MVSWLFDLETMAVQFKTLVSPGKVVIRSCRTGLSKFWNVFVYLPSPQAGRQSHFSSKRKPGIK